MSSGKKNLKPQRAQRSTEEGGRPDLLIETMNPSALALADFDVEADDAVLVAERNHRHIA